MCEHETRRGGLNCLPPILVAYSYLQTNLSTDAAMGERAECVMLNKGPYAVRAVSVLADILKRTQDHHEKKNSMLRQLHLAAPFPTTT